MTEIREVRSRRDLRRFVKFPLDLYRECPQYVPSLNSDQMHTLTANAALEYCSHKLWLAFDGGKVVGRICGIINPHYNERYGTRRARFGWFDTVNSREVASALLSTAEAWARENGMDEVHGPLFFNTLGKQGMLVEGYENIPPFNCLYNFPYYNDLVESLGYVKECDWIQYRLRADQEPDARLQAVAGRLSARYKVHEGNIDVLKKDRSLIHRFFRMYSDSFATSVYNFIPFTDAEIEEEAAQVTPFLTDRLCCFLLDEDEEIAGFGVSFPSMSRALQKAGGRLFPFGWIHMLKAMRNCENIDLMLNGATPKWQGSGISAVFHVLNAAKFRKAGAKWAVTNPQIEDNNALQVWKHYDCEPYMRRRCYIKKI